MMKLKKLFLTVPLVFLLSFSASADEVSLAYNSGNDINVIYHVDENGAAVIDGTSNSFLTSVEKEGPAAVQQAVSEEENRETDEKKTEPKKNEKSEDISEEETLDTVIYHIKENDATVSEHKDEDTASEAVSYALSKLEYPYSQARRLSGSAYDCSSLVYYSYLSSGINLSYRGSNTAASMANGLVSSGKEVSVSNLQPGDLIFYSYNKNGRYHNIDHVAMYIGNGRTVEASSSNGKVVIASVDYPYITDVCRPV